MSMHQYLPGLLTYTAHMQFLAAKSLCTTFIAAKYSIPLATWKHISISRLRTVSTCKVNNCYDIIMAEAQLCAHHCRWNAYWWQLFYSTHFLVTNFSCLWNYQCAPLVFQIGQETSICHKWHDDVRGSPSIYANTTKGECIWMIKWVHFWALF